MSEQENLGSDLFWDATYAIAISLIQNHPDLFPEDVGIVELESLVLALPNFQDDPDIVNEQILFDIQAVWFEEYEESLSI